MERGGVVHVLRLEKEKRVFDLAVDFMERWSEGV
jgi:hypothetical protein